jgi:hypothetical protein
MRIKFIPQRNDNSLEYQFDGEVITATYNGEITDTFDFSHFEEGDKADVQNIETALPVNPIISARRENGEVKVELLKYHGNLQAGAEYPNTDWQEV